MLNVLIIDETVVEHGSLAAELLSMNGIGTTLAEADRKQIKKSMQKSSPSRPLVHLIDRTLPIAAFEMRIALIWITFCAAAYCIARADAGSAPQPGDPVQTLSASRD